jgi:hypothetical protein
MGIVEDSEGICARLQSETVSGPEVTLTETSVQVTPTTQGDVDMDE